MVEHDLAKVGVASSSLVFRSNKESNLKCCSSGKAHVQKDASEEAESRIAQETKKDNVLVAQLVEQLTLNQWVQGSNPCQDTYRGV